MRKTFRSKQAFILGLAVAATGIGATSALAADVRICFEAETATNVKPSLRTVNGGSVKGYSGTGYIDIPWDQNKTKGIGDATYKINVKKPGTYKVWA
ncbi:MAG: hypothetical protein M3347_08100, partial [Armatimonadota bacterium]|nr:hypothetical protein [Armatimonadota bacterium]